MDQAEKYFNISREAEEFYQYINCKSKCEFIKKIISSPMTSLNIIIWKPAKYAFYYILNLL